MKPFLTSFALLCLMAIPSHAQIRASQFLKPNAEPQQQPDLPPQLLEPRFEPGKTYRFVTITNVTMSPAGESPRQILLQQQARYDVNPRGNGAKGVAIRALTERLQVKIQSSEKQIAYDSLQKENKKTLIGRHFDSSVNRYVKMELNDKMKILSHEEQGRAGAATPLPGLPKFGPDELIQIVTTIPQGYAPDPVKLGDEWVLKGKRAVGELGELGFEISYKHLGMVEHDRVQCMNIQFLGHLTGDISDNNSGNTTFQGSKIFGVLRYDPEAKMTRYSEHDITMLVNIAAKGEKKRAVPMNQKMVLQLMQVVDQPK